MTSDVDPFDEGVPRDGRGRPLIVPLKRGKPDLNGKPVAYTRASTFAKALDDGAGLTAWKVRHAVLGVACNPDLAAMAAALGRNLNAFTRDAKANLDALVERAHDRSGGNEKADYGTAVHSLTEPGGDHDPLAIDDRMTRDVDAYRALVERLDLDVVDTEVFTVNDDVKMAGTYDHAYRFRSDLVVSDELTIPAGTKVIGDKKTGTIHLGDHAIQLALYARGKRYDYATGERESLDVSPLWGLVIHVPRGEGKAVAYLVDLAAGWKGAKLAGEVRAWRSAQRTLGKVVADSSAVVAAEPAPAEPVAAPEPVKYDDGSIDAPLPLPEPVAAAEPVAEPVTPEPVAEPDEAQAIATVTEILGDGVLEAIRAATSREECAALWRTYAAAGAWRDEHTAAVKARIGELAAA